VPFAAGSLISTTSNPRLLLTVLFEGELISADAHFEMLATGPDGYGFGTARQHRSAPISSGALAPFVYARFPAWSSRIDGGWEVLLWPSKGYP